MCKIVVNNLKIETTAEGKLMVEAIAPAEDKVIDITSQMDFLNSESPLSSIARIDFYAGIGAAFECLNNLGYTIIKETDGFK